MNNPLPLAGVRVLAVEQYGAGPYGTMYLADQGADVVKIENPVGGDFARDIGPYWFGDGLQWSQSLSSQHLPRWH